MNQVRKRSRRGGSRSRAEIEAERDGLWKKTCAEVDQSVAEAHAELAREEASLIGAIYARYSSQHQDSVADQVRTLMREAVKLGIFVPREFVFFDLAVKGCKTTRVGLDNLKRTLERRTVNMLLIFGTNRLFRKAYESMQFVDRLVEELDINAVFWQNHIDTRDKKRWKILLQIAAIMDEQSRTMYADNIRAAHVGLMERGFVFGTATFGYMGEPVPGLLTRKKQPMCLLRKDEETAGWVRQIYAWYVADRLTIDEIVRRLNADDAIPLPPRSTTGQWTRDAVMYLLKNPRYRGFFVYGKTETIWITAKDYARQKCRTEGPVRELQIDDLRIVEDDIWYQAQQLLADNRKYSGRKPTDGDCHTRPKLLHGFCWCVEHARILYVAGAHGRMLVCPMCKDLPADKQALYSQLNRKLVLELLCTKLAELIRADADLVTMIVESCKNAAATEQKGNPDELKGLRAEHKTLTKRIEFNQKNAGTTDEDQQDTQRVLRGLRAKREQIVCKISELEAAERRPIRVPSTEEVESEIEKLEELLLDAARGAVPEEWEQVREVIQLLTGGRIELYQMGERKPKRGWLQGRFKVSLLSVLTKFATDNDIACADGTVEVAIDFKPVSKADAEAERAYLLHESNTNRKIAEKEGWSRSKVTGLLKRAYARRGQQKPDGRKDRAAQVEQRRSSAEYQDRKANVMRRFDGEPRQLIGDIAADMDLNRDTVKAIVAEDYDDRGLPIPDGRHRRKMLTVKVCRRSI